MCVYIYIYIYLDRIHALLPARGAPQDILREAAALQRSTVEQ